MQVLDAPQTAAGYQDQTSTLSLGFTSVFLLCRPIDINVLAQSEWQGSFRVTGCS